MASSTQQFAPYAQIPPTQVELAVKCRNLIDADVFSLSDPMCVLRVKQFGSDQWQEFGRSETIWNNLNPNFVKKFVLDYFFEEAQKLRFEIYDVDSKSQDLKRHDYLGYMECTLGEIVSSSSLKRKIIGPKSNSGHIIVYAEELGTCKEDVTLQFCGRKVDKKDLFGKSDPFLWLYRSNEDGTFTVVHRTEIIKVTLNPIWTPFTIPVRALCNGDYHRVIMIECYDWDKDGRHKFIGEFFTTMNELKRGACPDNMFECINNKKKAKKGKKYTNSGTIELLQYKLNRNDSFLDYVRGGFEIQCAIAVDFTSSNGNPAMTNSLHYNNENVQNHYQRALRAVGEVIQDYDTDKLFPALGFGAKIPPDGNVSHMFHMNGNPNDPNCERIDGVMDAYKRTLRSVQLHGPTNFAPCINYFADIARQNQQHENKYFILLILTDGIITDMPQTCHEIVKASALPLSIIIVGIGNADFEAMNILDGDDKQLTSRGRTAERDIVQFVPFSEFVGVNDDLELSQARLAKEVLAEIPDQFLSYMKATGTKPGLTNQGQSLI